MIPLRIRAEALAGEPFVVRLPGGAEPDDEDASLLRVDDGGIDYSTASGNLRLVGVSVSKFAAADDAQLALALG